jgi:tetratricopeptide (TPR) repeat protein
MLLLNLRRNLVVILASRPGKRGDFCLRVPALASGMILLFLLVVPSWAERETVPDLFRQARFEEARQTLLSETFPADASWLKLYWQMRLTKEPAEALSTLQALGQNTELPAQLRVVLALEEATLQFARGRFQAALVPIEELQSSLPGSLPGEIYLVAGLTYWALHRVQESREAFASVAQNDQAFPWARYYLGCIGLETGDIALAMRYFSSAEKGDLAPRLPALLVGTWEGLRRSGRAEEAEVIYDRVLAEHPQCLELIRLREISESQQDVPTAAAWVVSDGSNQEGGESSSSRGRVTLQLGAFADRGRALAFLTRWQGTLSALRLEDERGSDGQLLYKVRSGWFVSRAQAQTEAKRLQRLYDLEVLVVEAGS